MTDARVGSERLVVAAVGVIAAAPIAAQTIAALAHALTGCGLPPAIPTTGAALGLAALATIAGWHRAVAARLPSELDGAARRHPFIALLWGAAAIAAIVQTARASVFMADAEFTAAAVRPRSARLRFHSGSGTFVAAAMARHGVANLWNTDLFPTEPAVWAPRREPLDTRGFRVDRFNYAPPALLVPSALLRVSDDYLVLRTLWFGIETAGFGSALIGVALWIRGRAGAIALLLVPLVWVATPTRLTLEFGHIYPVVLAASVGAMIAFRARRFALGGAALALATLVRLSPGVLIVQLLAARRWRELRWTAAAGLALVAVTLAVFGAETWRIFLVEQLPRIAGGTSTPPMTASALRIADNLSPTGLVLKLSAAGLVAIPSAATTALQWAFVLGGAALAVRAARRGTQPRAQQAAQWLAALNVAALATPSAPATYLSTGLVWQAALVIAQREARGAQAMLGAVVLAACFGLPVTTAAAPHDFLLPFTAQLAGMALIGATLAGR